MTDQPKRTRGWNKREVPRVPVLIRFEPADLEAVDRARGDTPKQEWIMQAIRDAIAGKLIVQYPEAAAPTKAAKPALQSPRAPIGSRLDKKTIGDKRKPS